MGGKCLASTNVNNYCDAYVLGQRSISDVFHISLVRLITPEQSDRNRH
jgi:hypothetical protein